MTLLTVTDLRGFPVFAASTLSDEWLQTLLDAAEGEIERVLGGPVGAVTEVLDASLLSYVTLRRRAESITAVTTVIDQVSTTLAADDYRLRWDARSIQRLGTGTNPSWTWGGTTTVVYAASDDEASRKRVQKELVELDVQYAPGITQEQIGAWLEAHQQSSVWNMSTERRAILSTLWPLEDLDFA